MDKLHVGTVKSFGKEVNAHKNLYAVLVLKCPYHFSPFLGGRLGTNRHSIHPLQPVKLSDMLRMGNVDGVDNSLLVLGEPLKRRKQPFNAWPHVQFLPQLLHLEISVRTTFLQGVYFLLLLAVRTDGIIGSSDISSDTRIV